MSAYSTNWIYSGVLRRVMLTVALAALATATVAQAGSAQAPPTPLAPVVVDGSFTLPNLSAGALRGIEVYRGAASTPVELRSARGACGTVAIWTK